MKGLFSSRAVTAAGVATIALLAAGGGYAVAGGSGTVGVCVSKSTGTLYRGKCHRHDGTLRWSAAGPQGKQGVQGKQGNQGPQGNPGNPGNPGQSGATNVVVRTEPFTVSGGGGGSSATCQPGERAVGGGGDIDAPGVLRESAPTTTTGESTVESTDGQTPTGWTISFIDNTGNPLNGRVYVVCSSP